MKCFFMKIAGSDRDMRMIGTFINFKRKKFAGHEKFRKIFLKHGKNLVKYHVNINYSWLKGSEVFEMYFELGLLFRKITDLIL